MSGSKRANFAEIRMATGLAADNCPESRPSSSDTSDTLHQT